MTLRKKMFWTLLSLYILSLVAVLCWRNTGTIIITCAATVAFITFSIIYFNRDVKKQESEITPKVNINDINPDNHLVK